MKYTVRGICVLLGVQFSKVTAATWHRSLRSDLLQRKEHHDEGLQFSFEIKNYNYYDLSKVTCPEDHAHTVAPHEHHSGRKGTAHVEGVANAMDEILHKTHTLDDIIHDGMDAVDGAVHDVEHGVQEVGHGVEEVGKEIGDEVKHAAGDALLQVQACMAKHKHRQPVDVEECESVEDVFRHAVEEVVKHTIDCYFGHPAQDLHDGDPMIAHFDLAPAPAVVPTGMAPTGFLQNAPAPAPTMAAIHGAEEIEVYVAFEPGKPMGAGKTTIVDILVYDLAGGIAHDLEPLEHMFQEAMYSPVFNEEMAHAFQAITGVHPALGIFSIKKKQMALWNVTQCEGHLKSLVSRFAKTYTRERVPSALYNECTNFMTRMSFSHDYVLDPRDTVVCRQTTARFAKHWDYGKNAEDADFELMCVHACKTKYGKDAPRCVHDQQGPAPAPATAPAPAR